MTDPALPLTRAAIHLDRLRHNLALLQKLVGQRPMWPAIKSNGYGHDLLIIGRELSRLGYTTLCVAHLAEALKLNEAGIEARAILLSEALPEQAAPMVELGCEPVLCTMEMAAALSRAAVKMQRPARFHLMVDTGMGRIGIPPRAAADFLARCRVLPGLELVSVMSHFPCADRADKTLSVSQLEQFTSLCAQLPASPPLCRNMANSAAILDLPASHLDAVRPGIAIYGLSPSAEMINPLIAQLKPVMEWKSRITFIKEVAANTGLSYCHSYHTREPALIATLPVGYGDGLDRNLSNRLEILVGGRRCPQVGRITMDQCLVDVSALRGRVALGDEAVLIGCQGGEEIRADELAQLLHTINYEIVTRVGERVARLAVGGSPNSGAGV